MIVTSLLFLVRRLKAWVLMQINMAVSKADIYKIHPKNLHIFSNKGNFDGCIFEVLTSKILNNSDQCIQVTYKVNRSKLNTTIDGPNWSESP